MPDNENILDCFIDTLGVSRNIAAVSGKGFPDTTSAHATSSELHEHERWQDVTRLAKLEIWLRNSSQMRNSCLHHWQPD
jgi:hypothetical protein